MAFCSLNALPNVSHLLRVTQSSCSHSLGSIPASFKTRLIKDQSTSPRCGLGMVIARVLLTMVGCFPPGYGPDQPNLCRRRTIFRQLMGFGIVKRLAGIDIDAANHRELVLKAKLDYDPIL